MSRDIWVGSLRVIAFHLETNSMDHRGWGGKVLWQQQLSSMQGFQHIIHDSIWVYVANVYFEMKCIQRICMFAGGL